MRALVIEDDPTAARLVRLVLAEDAWEVDDAATGQEGRRLARAHAYDLIVLDLGLRDLHGIAVVQDLRQSGRATPVLILTGETAEQTMIRGLDAGADDYMTKPFSREALRARARALVRRGAAGRADTMTVGNLSLNRLTREVRVDSHTLALTPREFALLEYLMLRHDEVVSRPELLEKVWDMHFDPGSNVVDAHVARVRRKLEDGKASAAITTSRGVGFSIGAASGAPPR